MVIVSACLVGLCTRYDGSSATTKRATELLKKGEAIPVCPEQLAGLPTPRPKSTLSGGDGTRLCAGGARFITKNSQDLTEMILRACEQIAALAKACGAKTAILKDGSPSCGVSDTNVDWEREEGMGVLAAVLTSAGIRASGI